jgi:type II secretory pathway predicted ATPase ExeA
MNRLQALHGLKFNPFSPELPAEALFVPPKLDGFGRRLEHLVREGGFALITGEPGMGKSAALRVLDVRLGRLRDVKIRTVTHPQSGVGDFYRELGDLFTVPLSPHNRWGGFKALRDKWQSFIDSTLVRPVLFIDEAQEMTPAVLSELRLLSSKDFDSRSLLSVVLAGDKRLPEKFRSADLLPLGSRIRTRLLLDRATPDELAACLRHVLAAAGNASLLTDELLTALAEHAAGNYRLMMNMAADLLAVAVDRELAQLDEKLFFEVFSQPNDSKPSPLARGKRR